MSLILTKYECHTFYLKPISGEGQVYRNANFELKLTYKVYKNKNNKFKFQKTKALNFTGYCLIRNKWVSFNIDKDQTSKVNNYGTASEFVKSLGMKIDDVKDDNWIVIESDNFNGDEILKKYTSISDFVKWLNNLPDDTRQTIGEDCI